VLGQVCAIGGRHRKENAADGKNKNVHHNHATRMSRTPN
jgi:hypothetical protein